MPLPPPDIFIFLSLVIGLILGSFYNVCVHRYLSGESVIAPRSKCPTCEHPLNWWENIPLLSYALLRGRCHSCRERISTRYPAVELTSCLWAAGLAWKFGPSWAWALFMAVGGLLIVASFIDLECFILPDRLILPAAVLALVGAPLAGWLSHQSAWLGAAGGAGLFLALQWAYRLLRRTQGLGTGDIKLMLALGAMVGVELLPLLIFLAASLALCASLYYLRRPSSAGMQTMLPFGPFLALSSMVCVLYGDPIMKWLVV